MSTWATMIQDLRAAGLTLAQIGERVGLAIGSVGDIASGRTESPRGDAAILLHKLHAETCKRSTRERAA